MAHGWLAGFRHLLNHIGRYDADQHPDRPILPAFERA
jgi:hypothetical protein